MAFADNILVTEPSGVRFSVSGNVLSLKNPRSTWEKYFKETLQVSSCMLPHPRLVTLFYLRKDHYHRFPLPFQRSAQLEEIP